MRMLLFFFILFLVGCQEKATDLDKERKAIEALIRQERKAHFERNADLFISEFSDSMISVNRGEVLTATREERKHRIQNYFSRSQFIKWDDVVPPQIRFSEDGSLAYAVIQKQVILSQVNGEGKAAIDTSEFAWVSIYRKTGNEWKVECNVSTNK